MTIIDKKAAMDIKKMEKFNTKIEDASNKIEAYFEKNPSIKKDVPDTKFVVYSNIVYPIAYEISKFFYLGGNNLYMVLKSKCVLKNTGKVFYYQVIASEGDIDIGKSPIIPVGCRYDNAERYPADMASLEIKI